MQTFRQDLIYAFQQIKRGKGVAAIVVLMIAIGIGANTAIFGLFKATLNQAPFRDIDRLVRIRMTPPDQGESNAWIAIPEYIAIQEENKTFEVIVTPADATTFVNVALLFTVVAAVASIVPMLRALRLEPRAVLAEA
jgi:ABC-type antimicrobial peptide transport system permease subunit